MNKKLITNISVFDHCYGCGVCTKACPVHIIDLKINKDGFYSPVISDESKCIKCGLCLKVCAFNHNDLSHKPTEVKSYAAWSNDSLIREWCSSGGIGFEIGRHLIEEGYNAIGVRYNLSTNRAEHYIAKTVEEFMPSVGSKYIPSNTQNCLSTIDRNQKYFVTGTPCQIDSFRRYIRHFNIEKNFVLLDFFCHGVPSLLLWDKYISGVSEKVGEISFVSWRNKTTGWHDSWSMNADNVPDSENRESIDWRDSYNLTIREKKHLYQSRRSQGDLFYRLFLGNYCLNKCCYENCKYKMTNSSADIRIGDLWGSKYSTNAEGVSACLSFSEIGDEILKKIKDKATLVPEDLSIVTEGQMRENAPKPRIYPLIMKRLHSNKSLESINNMIKLYQIYRLPIRIINKLQRLILK